MSDEEAKKIKYHDILWVNRGTRWDQVIVREVDFVNRVVRGRYQDYSNPMASVFGEGQVPFDMLHWKAPDKHMGMGAL